MPVKVPRNWHATEAGPPCLEISKRALRYRREEVSEWRRTRQRIEPEEWQIAGVATSETAIDATEFKGWLLPKQAAAATGIPVSILHSWIRRRLELPFIWIGGGGSHQVMFDRRDVEEFIRRRDDDPPVIAVIPKAPDTRRWNADV